MMEERYHATTQNRFYPDMSNVNKNITVEAKLISSPTYIASSVKRLVLILLTEVMVTKLVNTCCGQNNEYLNNKASLILATTVLYLLLDTGVFTVTAQY